MDLMIYYHYIYNTDLIKQIVLKLNNKYNIIYSSDLCINNAKMIDIYSNCFMGIRLCENDGNANTVQEMGLLGLPVLHNGLYPNSVPWFNNIDLICEKIDYIYNNFWERRNIIAESMEKYLSDDKRENMCIFVPMWYRHETTEKNIHLLSKQIYQKTKIILIYSNEEDKQFAKKLENRYSNLYSIEVENRPLSKKFQYGAEFCKIFYPKGIIINGSDDFLSLNYSKCVEEYFNKSCNYIGCNFWYVGDLASMLLYKFKYKDNNRVVGCGRAFKYDLLDKLNWQVFPLDRNSGIDGASKVMIENHAKFQNLEEPKCFTFSFKEKTDMITPMSNLLKSEHNTHEIISDIKILKIMYSTNLYELEMTFKFQETAISNNLYLFVTLLDNNLKRSNPVMLNSYYMEKVLDPYFDIIDIRSIDMIKLFNYKLIFIDGIALNIRTSKMSKETLFNLLYKIKNIPKVLLAHDIHDYTFDFDNTCQPIKQMIKRDLKPDLNFNINKKTFLEFLKYNNFQQIITVCDCPEFDYMVKYYSDQIKKFFILSHHIPQEIFYPRVGINKCYDILIYGWTNSDIVYPFRTRLKRLFTSSVAKQLGINVHIIERTGDINKMPIENDLAELISKSWISICCTSNFSYLVRKYFEIGACGSIPCGNINVQGKSIFGNNIIELDENMSDYEILRIIKYYLLNPELLIWMSNQIKTIAQTYNYNMFMKKILEIKDDIINSIESDCKYNIIKTKFNSIDKSLKIHQIKKQIKLIKWEPNQKVILEIKNLSINVILEQDKSTPGIKINQDISPGKYILSFNYATSSNINCSVFCFGKNNKQIPIYENIVNNIICAYLDIEIKDNYSIFILATNPIQNESFTVSNITLKFIEISTLTNKLTYGHNIDHIDKQIQFYNKISYGSISCIGELQKLHTTFGGTIITKEQILSSNKSIKSNNYLVLLGLYSAHHWERIYKPLFNKFNRVMIIFTGTDIIQLSDSKISSELYNNIISELKNPKYILGALNERNLDEIKQKHNLDCNIISLPVGLGIEKSSITSKSKDIACYVGDNLEWYSHSMLQQVAISLPDYNFYIYKYGGFDDNFIQQNQITNIIYNKETITNFFEFMKTKLCSLRITYHDGEPMTGIETMIMDKYFIFNHKMNHSIYTETNPESIVETIKTIYSNVNNNILPNPEISKYYLTRNSNYIFESNLIGWFKQPNNLYKILEENLNINLIHKLNQNEQILSYNIDLIPGKYKLECLGQTNSYANLFIESNQSIKEISLKYSRIYNFETLSWIEFECKTQTQIKIGIIIGYPLENEHIWIRKLCIKN